MNRAGLASWPTLNVRELLLQATFLTIAVLVIATLAIVGDGNVVATVAPLIALTGLWLVWVSPIRATLLVLFFLGLSLDKPGDTEGLWRSPLNPLGGLLLLNLNQTINISALSVSGLVLLLALLLLIRFRRLLTSTSSDAVAAARPMMWGLAGSGLTALICCLYGIARGGELQMAKIQLQVFIPLLLMAYLLSASLRGLRDYRVLAGLLVAAACVKSLVVIWIRMTLPVPFGIGRGELAYVTTHGDSLLFACATVVLLGMAFERPVKRNFAFLALVLPVLMTAMVLNNRRLVWVEIGLALVIVVAMNPANRITRRLIRTVIYAIPLILLYVVAGWNSNSKIFAPVRTIRTMGDAQVDRSTLYRDGENYNLIETFKQNPVLGTGFGHPFELVVRLDDISMNFKEWRYKPHNSILGLWAFTGGLGFTGLCFALLIGLLLAARSYRFAKIPEHRMAASAALGGIATYAVHCWGDIGFTEPLSIFLVGTSLAVAGQLATLTGAWPSRDLRRPVHERGY